MILGQRGQSDIVHSLRAATLINFEAHIINFIVIIKENNELFFVIACSRLSVI
jgi:hypothetical protein